MSKLEFRGRVFSGSGEAAEFVKLPWFQTQVLEKVGFSPFLGTLNLRLSEESVWLRTKLRVTAVSKICSTEEYCEAALFKGRIGGTDCAVIVPRVKDYPRDVLEIVAPVDLRKRLKVNDGDEVSVEVSL